MKRLCVIDDDYIYIFSIKKLLSIYGYKEHLLVFNNGEEAISNLTSMASTDEMPDVIILDISMPVMDGWDFLHEYEKIKDKLIKDVKIYIVSSSLLIEDINRSKEYEYVADYIKKPISYEDLKRMLD